MVISDCRKPLSGNEVIMTRYNTNQPYANSIADAIAYLSGTRLDDTFATDNACGIFRVTVSGIQINICYNASVVSVNVVMAGIADDFFTVTGDDAHPFFDVSGKNFRRCAENVLGLIERRIIHGLGHIA